MSRPSGSASAIQSAVAAALCRRTPKMDRFIATTPFFSSEHRALAERVAEFAEREVEVRAGDDEQDVDEAVRSYVMLLFEADLLRYAVAAPGQPFDLR